MNNVIMCVFSEGGKEYAYSDPIGVSPGDKVVVETRKGEQVVTVNRVSLLTEFPFEIKNILRKV